MKHNPYIHDRRSIRLQGYDYAETGYYFVTVCAQGRGCLFGQITKGDLCLNENGQVVAESWAWLAKRYEYVNLDEWVLMPNHLHAIVIINDERRGGSRTAPTSAAANSLRRKPLGRLIGAFKTVSTKKVNELHGTPGTTMWQRNYYEHIIRDQNSLETVRRYIVNNPSRWEFDELYSGHVS